MGGRKNLGQTHFKFIFLFNRVPTLIIDGKSLAESVAIIEYIEKTRPELKQLLPKDPYLRAKVRQLAEIVNSGIRPLQNLEVLNKVEEELHGDRKAWAQHFIKKGMTAFGSIVKETRGKYCVGDEITLADVFIVPQFFACERFEVDLKEFPTLLEIRQTLELLPEFIAADPKNQPDYA